MKYYKYISWAKPNKNLFTWVSSLGKCGNVLSLQLSYVYEYMVNEADGHVFAKSSFLLLLGAESECISHLATVRWGHVTELQKMECEKKVWPYKPHIQSSSLSLS